MPPTGFTGWTAAYPAAYCNYQLITLPETREATFGSKADYSHAVLMCPATREGLAVDSKW